MSKNNEFKLNYTTLDPANQELPCQAYDREPVLLLKEKVPLLGKGGCGPYDVNNSCESSATL